MSLTTNLIETDGLCKRFGAVQAVKDVSIAIEAGSIHALVGENGAGKSTLGRLLTGFARPDKGRIRRGGVEVSYRSPHRARQDGLVLLSQELALLPAQTVVDNVLLGRETWREALFGEHAGRAGTVPWQTNLALTSLQPRRWGPCG